MPDCLADAVHVASNVRKVDDEPDQESWDQDDVMPVIRIAGHELADEAAGRAA